MNNFNHNRNVARSKTALENKDFTSAIKYCNDELKRSKTNVEIYLIRGSAYNQLDQIELALEDFKKAYQLDSNNLEILKKLFFLYSKNKDIHNCLIISNAIIQKYPSDNDELVFQEICRLLMEREQYENCLKLLKDIVKKTGEHHIYEHLIGLNYFFLKDFENGIKHFKKSLKIENNLKYLLSLTECYLRINENDKAYNELLSFWKENKDSTELSREDKYKLISTLAEVCVKSNRYDDAVSWYNELNVILTNKEEKIEIEHKKAYLYKMLKKYDFALNIYQTIITANSNSTTEFLECADLYMRQSKFKEAYEDYQKVLHLDRYNVPANLNMAKLCLMKQDYVKAKDLMLNLLPMNKKNISFLKQFVDIYLQLLDKEINNEEKTNENKLVLYETLIDLINLNPLDTTNYEKLIQLSIDDKKYDYIKDLIDKASEFVKDSRMYLLQAYVTSFIDSSVADSFYDNYLSHQGDESEVNYFKANNAFILSDYESALSYIEDCLNLNPYHLNGLELLIQVHIKSKNIEKALEASKNLVFNQPYNSEYHFKTGMLLARLKRYEESIEFFEKAIEINNFFLDSFYNLGNVYLRLNLNNEALKCYKIIIHLNLDYNNDVYIKIAHILKASK